MTLYEPAYVAIQQWYAPPDRPRAIAVLTSYTQKLWMGLKKKAAYLPG